MTALSIPPFTPADVTPEVRRLTMVRVNDVEVRISVPITHERERANALAKAFYAWPSGLDWRFTPARAEKFMALYDAGFAATQHIGMFSHPKSLHSFTLPEALKTADVVNAIKS